MHYNFDEIQFRKHTSSTKWNPDFYSQRFHGHKDLLPLWVADMDFKVSKAILERLQRVVSDGVFGYTSFDLEYYDAIISWEKRRHGLDIKKEQLRHVPSIVPALNFLVQAFTEKGESVIIQPPVYPPFFSSVTNNERDLVSSPLKETSPGYFVMDYADFEQKVVDHKVRLFLLCNPHNPGGRVWTEEELATITAICLEHNVLIVADEIHCDLTFFGNRYTPVLNLSQAVAEQTVVCKSASKTFNLAGTNIAHLIIPNPALRERFDTISLRNALGGSNIFAPEMVKGAYLESDDWYDEMLAYIEKNIIFAADYIAHSIPGLSMQKQESTYLGFIDARQLLLTPRELETLCEEKAKVAFNYGHWFGKGGEGFLRINLACPQSLVEEGLDRLKNAIIS